MYATPSFDWSCLSEYDAAVSRQKGRSCCPKLYVIMLSQCLRGMLFQSLRGHVVPMFTKSHRSNVYVVTLSQCLRGHVVPMFTRQAEVTM